MGGQSPPEVRRAVEDDLPVLVDLVHELAAYEREPDSCHLTVEQLRTALFDPLPTLFGHVAVNGGQVVGCALWFPNFSTWEGVPGIYLEDLVVRESHRGGGHGRALLSTLARECRRRGWTRLQWQVLDWNEPSLEFYRRLGAREDAQWLNYGLTGQALAALAEGAGRAG